MRRVTLVVVEAGAPSRAELMAARASNVCAATRGTASAAARTPVQQTFTPYGWRTARSGHRGGVNLVFADGSLQLIADTIDLDIWRAMSTIAGNEVVGLP